MWNFFCNYVYCQGNYPYAPPQHTHTHTQKIPLPQEFSTLSVCKGGGQRYGQFLELHNANCEPITCRLQPRFCSSKMAESIGSSLFVICIDIKKNT